MCMSEGVAKKILVVLNIIFFLLGAVLITLAAIILTDNTQILDYLGRIPISSSVLEQGLYSTSWLYNFSYMMICAGGFFFVVGGSGLFGACCKSGPLLVIYATILFLIILVELGVVAMAILYRNKVVSYLLTFLQTSIEDYYIGMSYIDGTITLADDATGVSTAWDLAQIQFECCGANNSSDYSGATKWPGNYTVSGQYVEAVVPLTCCMVSDKTGWPADPSALTFTDINTCLTTGNSSATNTQGCYDSIYNKLKSYSLYCAIVAAIVGIVEISGMWAAISLYKAVERNKVVPA